MDVPDEPGDAGVYPYFNFPSTAYYDANYGRELRPDDAEMWAKAAAHLGANRPPEGLFSHGLDMGAGPNLHNAMILGIHCREVTLVDFARTNVGYLKERLEELRTGEYAQKPDEFGTLMELWDTRLSMYAGGKSFAWMAERLPRITEVQEGSIFDDPPLGKYDVGTMSFVIENLTTDPEKFADGLGNFFKSLQPGSPFVNTFMERSTGFVVGGKFYNAFPLTVRDASEYLEAHAYVNPDPESRQSDSRSLQVGHVDPNPAPLRENHPGFIYTQGVKKGERPGAEESSAAQRALGVIPSAEILQRGRRAPGQVGSRLPPQAAISPPGARRPRANPPPQI